MESLTLMPNGGVPVNGERRAYIGDIACPRWLDTFDTSAVARLLRERAVTLVLPPLTQGWLARFEGLLKRLPEELLTRLEVSANDIGTLAMAASCGATPVVGCWLVRQDTDPDIASFFDAHAHPPRRVILGNGAPALLSHAPPPDTLAVHWQTPSLFAPQALAALSSAFGCHAPRVEAHIPLHGLTQVAPGCRVSAYVGIVPVALCACRGCADCPQETVPLGYSRSGAALYRRRNLVFYSHPDGSAHVPQYVDRVINLQ